MVRELTERYVVSLPKPVSGWGCCLGVRMGEEVEITEPQHTKVHNTEPQYETPEF